MSMGDWARREVELACKKEAPDRKGGEWDYGCACYESALKAYLSLCEDDHSGMSFGLTRNILIRLLYECPLTPIEDSEDVWNLVSVRENGTNVYQCKRLYSLFKYVAIDGTVEYSADNYCCIDKDSGLSYMGGHAYEVLMQYIEPIKMPYYPPEKKYVIYTRECLTDRKNGDWDTMAYLYIKCPDGSMIDINRYFGETENGWQEIDKDEYDRRWLIHKERERQEKANQRE